MKKIVFTFIMALAAIGATAQHRDMHHHGNIHHRFDDGFHTGVSMHHHMHPSNSMILDVVYLKNGSELVGMITEMIPGKGLTLLTYDGSIHYFSNDEIIMTGKRYGRWSREYRRQIRQMGSFNNPMGYFGIAEFSTALMFTSENIRLGLTLINGYRFKPQLALGLGTGVRLYAHDGELCIPLFLHLRSDFFDRNKTPFVALNAGVQWSTGEDYHAGLILEPSFGYSMNTGMNSRLNFSIGLAVDMYDDLESFDFGTNFKIGFSF